MFNLDIIISYLKHLEKTSYLPLKCFDLNDSVLFESCIKFQQDYLRWYPSDIDYSEEKLMTTPQLIAILCYRIAHSLFTNKTSSQAIQRKNELSANAYSLLGRQIGLIELYYSSQIGEAFKINHGIGSVIGARCKIGNNCMIHQGCTIGDKNGGRPTIGNNVIMYAGCTIIGDVIIGDNSIVGANSVVTKSCPEGSLLVGSPAKIIKTTYDSLNYPN